MSKKMGRPTDSPKPFQAMVRLDVDCKQILDRYCEREKVNQAEAIRRGIKKLEQDLSKK